MGRARRCGLRPARPCLAAPPRRCATCPPPRGREMVCVRSPPSSCPRSPRIPQSDQGPTLTASVRTRLHRKRVYPFAVPLRGEGVLGPGPGRAAGSIAGHAGAKPRVRRRTGRRRLSWAKTRKGTNRDRTKASGKRPPALPDTRHPAPERLRKPVERSQGDHAETLLQAAVGDGGRHGPGRDRPGSAASPTRSQRKSDESRLIPVRRMGRWHEAQRSDGGGDRVSTGEHPNPSPPTPSRPLRHGAKPRRA
ncbi:hypothetical protein MMB232_02671 [Brevundimonas subvibrioides]